MGFIVPDLARTPEDFAKCRELIAKYDPSGIVAPLEAGKVYIIRDEQDRSTIHAMIAAENVMEVRHMLVNPEYNHSTVSFTVLHRSMEMLFRANNVKHYFFTVNKQNKRVITLFEKDGAKVVDQDAVRFLREL